MPDDEQAVDEDADEVRLAREEVPAQRWRALADDRHDDYDEHGHGEQRRERADRLHDPVDDPPATQPAARTKVELGSRRAHEPRPIRVGSKRRTITCAITFTTRPITRRIAAR